MSYIKIHQEKIKNVTTLVAFCPFGAIESSSDGVLSIGSGCRNCRLCVKKFPEIFEFVEEITGNELDKSAWCGITVVAEVECGKIHPVTLELLGKARKLAKKVGHPVYCVLAGNQVSDLAQELLCYGADEVFVYDHPALEHFRIEPYTAVLEDFINRKHPSVVLVGGTPAGRSLAPRTAARFHTGLTADCTKLDISESTDLDQIRPAYGGNIMAHINTPRHRPQFATVRYKIFSIPRKLVRPRGKITPCEIPPEKLASKIEVLDSVLKSANTGIEEADVLVAAGRGVRSANDLDMLRELATLLNGRLACSRPLAECGWFNNTEQIGLSGRTVKPKLIITCGVSGAIQFVAGMNNSDRIIAINNDPEAAIFKIAHVGIHGDLYQIVPQLIAEIKKRKSREN